MPIDCPPAEQHALRCSQLATVMDDNPNLSGFQLYHRLRGNIEPQRDNRLMAYGRIMEEPIAQMVALETGCTIKAQAAPLLNPDVPWLVGHIDRVIENTDTSIKNAHAILEITNVSQAARFGWGASGSDDVSFYKLWQAVGYLLLAPDVPEVLVAAYFGGQDLRLYPLNRSQERMAELMAAAVERGRLFWEAVQSGRAPSFDKESAETTDTLRRLYSQVQTGTECDLGYYLQAFHEVAEKTRRRIKERETVLRVFENELLAAMGNNEIGRFPNGSGYRRKVIKKRKPVVIEPHEYVDLRYVRKVDK